MAQPSDDARPGASPLRTVVVRAGQFVATLLVLWFVVDRAGLSLGELGNIDLSVWEIRPLHLVVGSLVLLIGYLVTGALWGRIVKGLGGPTLPTSDAIRLFMIANMGRYVPGKVWQIAGLAALARGRGVPATTATAAAILGQGIAIGAAAAVGMGTLWTLADGAAWRWAVPAALLGGVAVTQIPPVFDGVTRAWFRASRTEPPEGLGPRDAASWVAIGLTSWTIYATSFWLFTAGLGYDMSPLVAGPAFAGAYVVGYLWFLVPAGLGVRETILMALLGPHLGTTEALSVAIAARLWTTMIEVIPAALFWAQHVAKGAPTVTADPDEARR